MAPPESVLTISSHSEHAGANTRGRDNTTFLRLWNGFLTARVMVAVALLVLHLLAWSFSQQGSVAVMACSFGYLLATLVLRIAARHAPPPPQPGVQWLASIGVDIAAVVLLQLLQAPGTLNYTPLLGLPILMASVLGTLVLALGTTAAVTLLLLAWAWWPGSTRDMDAAYLQAALTSTGYFILAYLVHQLSSWLTRTQQVAQRSRLDARTQKAVSALVMEHVADGVLVVDHDAQVHLANPAAQALLGRGRQALAPFALGAQAAWAPLVQLAQRQFAQHHPQHADVTLLHPGQGPVGLRVRTWLTARQGHDTDTQAPLCVMFLHDLREMQARLRTEKLAAMGRMSAAVAHEIRNPLAAIVQANALLDEDLDDPVHKRLTQMVHSNAERLMRTTEDVLDIARVQRQVASGESAVLTLDDEVGHIVADWQAHAPALRTLQLQLDCDGVQVAFDAEHLRRLLVNLLDNALRYKGPHADSLRLSTLVQPDGRAVLQVWSDGAPLDQSVQQHLFEPFFSSESRSSGLGLFICRELCQRHGAAIGYQRSTEALARGATAGNAFTVVFRETTRPGGPASVFDTIIV